VSMACTAFELAAMAGTSNVKGAVGSGLAAGWSALAAGAAGPSPRSTSRTDGEACLELRVQASPDSPVRHVPCRASKALRSSAGMSNERQAAV
jgi:hypothetical protein